MRFDAMSLLMFVVHIITTTAAPGSVKKVNKDNEDGSKIGQCSTNPVVAVCVFGLVRNAQKTYPTFEQNVLVPLRQVGGVDVFVHTLLVRPLQNSTGSQEFDIHLPNSWERVEFWRGDVLSTAPACRWIAESQEEVDARHHGQVALPLWNRNQFGGSYSPASKRNLLRAYYSLRRAALMAMARESSQGFRYKIVAAVRIDTAILTPLASLRLLTSLRDGSVHSNRVVVPNFHHWGGINDRLAVGSRDAMFRAYTARWSAVVDAKGNLSSWALEANMAWNSEKILCHQLRRHNVQVLLAEACVVRIREQGNCVMRDLGAEAEAPAYPTCNGRGPALDPHLTRHSKASNDNISKASKRPDSMLPLQAYDARISGRGPCSAFSNSGPLCLSSRPRG